jgi:gliding motility-associated-like protein
MKLHKLLKNFLLLFALITALPRQLDAQNGQFQVRFTLKNYNCRSQNLIVAVQVRSTTLAKSFNMGDANYRFEYDPRVIRNPKIVSQDNFSNQPPANDPNYGAQNLNGSSAGSTIGLVSLNTFYVGSNSGAKRVDTSWTTISCLQFDVVSGQNCSELQWHDNLTFPVSGMSEVIITRPMPNFQFDLKVVEAGGFFGNLQACFLDLCANRPPSVIVNTGITLPEDSTTTICLPYTDADTNDQHTARLCQTLNNGQATINLNPTTKQVCVTFRPNANFEGRDSICLELCDNGAPSRCTQVRIPIVVNGRPDTPNLDIRPITVSKDSSFNGCFNILDPDISDRFTVTVCGVQNGTAQIQTPIQNRQACLNYRPNAGYVGRDTICLTVCDSFGLCRRVFVPVNVLPCVENAPPTLTCPPSVEVTSLGTIVKNDLNFLTNARISDNCRGVVLQFNTPTAQNNCGAVPVTQVAGDTSRSVFPIGTSNLTFEAKSANGITSRCDVQIKVTPQRLIESTSDTIIACPNTIVNITSRTIAGATNPTWTLPNQSTPVAANTLRLSNVNTTSNGTYVYKMTVGSCQITDSVRLQVLTNPVLRNDSFRIANSSRLTAVSVITNDSLLKTGLRIKTLSNATQGSFFFYNDGTFNYVPASGFIGTDRFAYEVCYESCPNLCANAAATIEVFSQQREGTIITNVITPNNDGVNDALTVKGLNPNATDNVSTITIYNQWGNVVYSKSPYKNDWEGTFNDSPLPDGTYYYVFRLNADTEVQKGFVTIVR